MNECMTTPAEELSGASFQCHRIPPHRILVVDDDPHICHFSVRLLVRQGYEVNVAADGAAGWDALQAASYDLLITDNDMPNMSGIELIKQVRATRMTLPVIMATGTLPQAEFIQNHSRQPAVVLLKPYAITEFLEAVKEVLRVTAAARELAVPSLAWQTRPPAGDSPWSRGLAAS